MKKHPVETAIARMLPRDQRIADQLAEAGFSDEALYAALPNPGADKLLRGTQPPKAKKRAAGVMACPECGQMNAPTAQKCWQCGCLIGKARGDTRGVPPSDGGQQG